MNFIKKIWHIFKLQPDIWFFYAFIATMTLSIRKIIYFYPINNQFNEYTGIYLYLSDLLLLLTIFFWIKNLLCNNIIYLSNKLSTLYSKAISLKNIHLILLFLFLLWSFFSSYWSSDKNIALFRSIKLLEMVFIYLFIIINVPRGTFIKNVFRIIITSALIQSIIGIWQFIIQKSIGIVWLKESILSSEIPGVAKLIINNETIIRSYGLFPHPNIFGGFLLISIVLTYIYFNMFHVEHSTPNAKSKCSTWNIFMYYSIQFIQIAALFLTFSKSAITGLAICIIYTQISRFILQVINTRQLNIFKRIANVPRGTLIVNKYILSIIIICILLISHKDSLIPMIAKSYNERVIFANISYEVISARPITGLGIGQFVLNMPSFTSEPLASWQFQPVHNIFLLIWSELGIIGLIIFTGFIISMFHVEHSTPNAKSKCSTWNIINKNQSVSIDTSSVFISKLKRRDIQTIFNGLFLSIIFIMTLDHYFWDINQGVIMLWIILAFLYSIKKY